MVDTSRTFAAEYLRAEQALTHSHGPAGAHEHGATDFNTWLDPLQALRQAGHTAAETAEQLNQEGFRDTRGQPFTKNTVGLLCRQQGG